MTAVVFDDAPTQAITSLFVCMKRACEELKDSDATIDPSEFTVAGGKRKRDDDQNVKLIDIMRLTKRRLRGLIKGSIPMIDPGVKTPAKKQIEHTFKDVNAYLGDLPYDFEESDDEDLPFKVVDSDDEEEEEEEGDDADDAEDDADDDAEDDADDDAEDDAEEGEDDGKEEKGEDWDKNADEEEDEEDDSDEEDDAEDDGEEAD
jgi:hypothetical protein